MPERTLETVAWVALLGSCVALLLELLVFEANGSTPHGWETGLLLAEILTALVAVCALEWWSHGATRPPRSG